MTRLQSLRLGVLQLLLSAVLIPLGVVLVAPRVLPFPLRVLRLGPLRLRSQTAPISEQTALKTNCQHRQNAARRTQGVTTRFAHARRKCSAMRRFYAVW